MGRLNNYLNIYAESHKNPKNILIHKFCVPAIMFSVFGFFKAIPVPETWPLWLDWSYIMMVGTLLFYASFKNLNIFIKMLIFIIPQALWLEFLKPRFFILCLILFIVAWIFQFIGHKIEGKKPSFFNNLLFLLIGPIWVMKIFDKSNNAKEI